MSLTSRSYDLEGEAVRLKSELSAMQATRGALEAQTVTNPHSRLAQAIQAQLVTLKQTEKFIAMRLQQIDLEMKANQQQQQSAQQSAQQSVKLFGLAGGGG
jgi:hypothetical protein